MDVVLIPGFWLDATSWEAVTPTLEAAGHTTYPLTLPGLESVDADRRGIGLADHVRAVVEAVDGLDRPVVLVGHSGGGSIAHAVADARPDRVARVVYVDSGPLGTGQAINDQLPEVDGEVPLPDWSFFSAEDLVDLDDGLRASFRTRSVPEPLGVTRDPFQLADQHRYDVPGTVISCQLPAAAWQQMIAQDHPWARELGRLRDVDFVDLPTGHWPQFTRPRELAAAVVAAIG
jgi:pimeloyl-ACP methyl ester carboxylesterase